MHRAALRRCTLLLVVFLVAAPCVSRLARAADAVDEEPEAEFDAFAEDEPVEEVDEKDVLVLTTKNFNDTVLKAPFALVEFYAPWCGHCQALKPEYAKAATDLKAANSDIVLAKVDATEEPELAAAYDVNGYPTLKWFVDGQAKEYSGGRSAEEILKWVKKKSGPPAETIRRVAEYQEIKKQNVYIIAFFDEFEGASHAAFLEAAKEVEDVPFYRTTDLSVAKKVGITKPGFVLTRTYPGAYGESAFLKDVSKEALVQWVQEEKLPAYLEFTDDNQGVIFNSGIKVNVILMGSKEQLAPGSPMVKAIEAAHLATKGKIVFVTSDLASENAEALVDFFEADPKAKNVQVVAFNLDTYAKYKLAGAPTAAALKAFAEGLLSGTVKPHYKSEEVPTGDDARDGDVVVVVGKNFEQVVLDETKDVLLEVYAPWCGHCKAMAPTYRKLAKRFRPVDSVVIAKMDGTGNEHENVTVEGYPSIFLFPAGKSSEPVAHEGADRSLKALTQFIKEHASGKFELPKKQTEEEDKADAEEAAARESEEQAAAYGDGEEDSEVEFDLMEAAEMQAAERQGEEEEDDDDGAVKDEL